MVVMVAVVREAVMGAVARVAVKEDPSPRPFCSCTAKAILSRGGATHRVGCVSWICSKLAAPMPETVLGRGNDSTRSFVDACAFSAVVRALPPITTRRGPAVALLDLRSRFGKSEDGNLPIRRASLRRTRRTGEPDRSFTLRGKFALQPCTLGRQCRPAWARPRGPDLRERGLPGLRCCTADHPPHSPMEAGLGTPRPHHVASSAGRPRECRGDVFWLPNTATTKKRRPAARGRRTVR